LPTFHHLARRARTLHWTLGSTSQTFVTTSRFALYQQPQPSVRSRDRESERFAFQWALVFWVSRRHIHISHLLFFFFLEENVRVIIRAEEKENGASVTRAWDMEFGLSHFYSAWYSLRGGVRVIFFFFDGVCIVMICPTQNAMFLRAFSPRVNALLSRLKDWAVPGIRMVVRSVRVAIRRRKRGTASSEERYAPRRLK